MITQIALPERNADTDFGPEEETRILEVLFDLLDQFLAERESIA
ncbi:hypothetical protein [Nocardia testacea]